MAESRPFYLTSLLISVLCHKTLVCLGTSDFGTQCIETCMREMQAILDSTPLTRGRSFAQLTWSELFEATKDTGVTKNAFAIICSAYENVETCLEKCHEAPEQHRKNIMETYAGLRYICVERRIDFFESLPCLASYEQKAMKVCKRQIDESLRASSQFSVAIVNKHEQHNLKTHFQILCTELKGMIDCIGPITRRHCGQRPANIMLKFITLGFASFEQLYSQLGITDVLPHTCRQLIRYGQYEDMDKLGELMGQQESSQFGQQMSVGGANGLSHQKLCFLIFTLTILQHVLHLFV